MRDIICTTCPKGCRISIDEVCDTVTGNACPRGAEFARSEVLHPARIITSTVWIEGSVIPRLPVKTDRPIPKEKMFACMALLRTIHAQAPVHNGAILATNILGTGANIVATKTL